MKSYRILLLFIMVLCAGLAVSAQEKSKECKGRYRWDVKTLTDSGGILVLSKIPYDSSISQLVKVKPPVKMFVLSKKDGRLPRFENEKYLVRMVALLEEMNIQKDKDYHIMLTSPDKSASLIGEIPDPECIYLSAFPVMREKFRLARIQGDSIYQLLKKEKRPILVEVTGVPFWDAPHFWIKGSCKTGREIHPILEIRMLEK